MGAPNDWTKMEVEDCPGGKCGPLLAGMGKTILAMAEPCAAQDYADKMINIAKTDPEITSQKTRDQIIAKAKAMLSGEKNTPDDWSKFPSIPLRALYCHKVPQNLELEGLVWKQDPKAPLDQFWDPRIKKVVKLDEVPETRPRISNTTITTLSGNTNSTTSSSDLLGLVVNGNNITSITPSSLNSTLDTEKKI
ncbi:hypothetical protein CROQUDRAFT_105511 [Cronartium quercuum f. sp. fusiforme G11]|uniref:Uncharacterized protein n=1 Tax=Cronartium quercuum f. sp. fusiforme G11 TaxID=708437 RepID=A0A9P6TDU1_9BASI|nr:hypothetical protein CROQUDRAFT_105511 [Cronartium quercuum f. sp. fusiforme G11]